MVLIKLLVRRRPQRRSRRVMRRGCGASLPLPLWCSCRWLLTAAARVRDRSVVSMRISEAALRRLTLPAVVAGFFAQLAACKALGVPSCDVRQQFVANRYASAHVKGARRISATGASGRRETQPLRARPTHTLALPAAAASHARNRRPRTPEHALAPPASRHTRARRRTA